VQAPGGTEDDSSFLGIVHGPECSLLGGACAVRELRNRDGGDSLGDEAVPKPDEGGGGNVD